MEAEDLAVDQGRKGEVVEQVGEVLPDIGIAVFAQALVVEAVDLCDLTRLVVTTEDRNPLRVPDLVGDEECNGLDGVVAAVDIITYAMSA